MKREQGVPVRGCCDRIEELAERAHENGEIFYLTPATGARWPPSCRSA